MPDVGLPRPAGLLRRLGAMFYDALIVVALRMMTLTILVVATNHAAVGPAVQSLLFVELFAYFTYFWVWRGQTIGMLAWDLRLENDGDTPLRLSQALLRFVGALLSFATLGVGYVWMYIDPDRRTWPDMLSRSHVTHLRRS